MEGLGEHMSLKKSVAYLVVVLVGAATLVSAALLGVPAAIVGPMFAFSVGDNTSATSYTANNNQFSVTSMGNTMLFFYPAIGPKITLTGAGVSINLSVDNSGNLIPTNNVNDIVITGTFFDPTYGNYSGTLLTGRVNVAGFGHQLPSSMPGTASFDFRFTITGGAMQSYPGLAGADLGVRLTSENFNGTFATDFNGLAKLQASPITACGGSIGNFVWHDVNGDGVQDNLNGSGGEPGLGGITVNLLNASGAVLATTTTDATTGPTLGHYTFSNLCAGGYKVQAIGPNTNFVVTTHNVPTNATSSANNSDATVITKIPVPNTAGQDVGTTGVVSLGASMSVSVAGTSVSGTSFPLWDAGTPVVITGSGCTTDTYYLQTAATSTNLVLTQNAGSCSGSLTTPMDTVVIDIGFFDWVDIGNYVWDDVNHNGLQNTLEPPIDGVTVSICLMPGCTQAYSRMRDSPQTLNVPVLPQVTGGWNPMTVSQNAAGHYLFIGLYPGTYKLTFTPPSGAGWIATIQGGLNGCTNQCEGNNSVINASGVTPSVVGKSGQNGHPDNNAAILYVDAGFYKPAPPTGKFTTYTQGGWGAVPKGNNPGALLTRNFSTVFPGGSVWIGIGPKLTFTSAAAITNFLPQGSTAGILTASATNPTTSSAGVFGGQLLAATLSVAFSNAGITQTGLGAKTLVSGPLAGQTVNQVLALANSVISGGALPSGLTLSGLNDILDKINNNYDNGTQNLGYLN